MSQMYNALYQKLPKHCFFTIFNNRFSLYKNNRIGPTTAKTVQTIIDKPSSNSCYEIR